MEIKRFSGLWASPMRLADFTCNTKLLAVSLLGSQYVQTIACRSERSCQ